MCDLQPTQSPPCSLEVNDSDEQIKTPWGRLISRMRELDAVDLVDYSVKLGRSESCDIIIHRSKFPENLLLNISKEHFLITKDPEGLVYMTDLSKNGTYINQELVGRNKKNIIRNNDVISVGHKKLIIYVFKHMDSKDEKYLPVDLRKKYETGSVLGRGAVGEVRLIYEKTTCKKFAVKKITKCKFNTSNLNQLNHPNKIYTEINILRGINHPCVISMKDIVETTEEVFIVLEYMEGGELTRRIEKNELTESQNKFYFYQMVLAVQHLHLKGITHRDLKPENVLLSSQRVDCLIKVSDFGLSKETEDNIMSTMCGTLHYVAPEVLDGRHKEYNNQVDIWSLGVILYYMMSKDLPFRSADRATLGSQIMKGEYYMKGDKWKGASVHVKDLINKMLTVDPTKRITVQGILKHPWISRDISMQYKVHDLIKTSELVTDLCQEPSAKRFRTNDDSDTKMM